MSQKEQLTLKGHCQLYLKSYIWEEKHKQSLHCFNTLQKNVLKISFRISKSSPKIYMDMTYFWT